MCDNGRYVNILSSEALLYTLVKSRARSKEILDNELAAARQSNEIESLETHAREIHMAENHFA